MHIGSARKKKAASGVQQLKLYCKDMRGTYKSKGRTMHNRS